MDGDELSFFIRSILNVIGSISLILGVLGIVLPLLPATPFLLLASACYLRGSERLHQWLLNSRFIGQYVRSIQERKGIPLRAKFASVAIVWTSLLYSVFKVEAAVLDAGLIVIGAALSVLIFRMKTLKQPE